MQTDLSRRFILKFAAAGSAATLPAVALAAADRDLVDPPQLSDEDQLEALCLQVEELLGRMHPVTEKRTHFYSARRDGTYRLSFHCERPWLEYSGPGLYCVSNDGYLMCYWLEQHEQRTLSGRIYGHELFGVPWDDREGRYYSDEVRRVYPSIVAKLDGPSPYDGASA
jgi:hypothetical protein